MKSVTSFLLLKKKEIFRQCVSPCTLDTILLLYLEQKTFKLTYLYGKILRSLSFKTFILTE